MKEPIKPKALPKPKQAQQGAFGKGKGVFGKMAAKMKKPKDPLKGGKK
jgi:hypothetical protein